jgi:membrane protein YqaA with SNARE-associated domain
LEHYFWVFLDWFGMPSVGLPAVFLVALISATLLPMGSEPVLFAYVSVNPSMLWPAIVIATVGNTMGGMINWLRMPWKACLIYMAIGKFLRYVTFTLILISIPSSFWHGIGRFFGIAS